MGGEDLQRRLVHLLLKALEAEPHEREGILQETCGGDVALKNRVESLLGRERDVASFLESFRPEEGELLESSAPKASEMTVDLGSSDAPALPELIGKYRILGRLGEPSGQAEVYRAWHPELEKVVVIKLGRERVSRDSPERDRVVREAKTLVHLEHPRISRVRDIDFQDERPFLVLDLVRGRNLDQFAGDSRVPPREAARIAAGVARALQYLHSMGVVHRDIKPTNVILDEHGEPHLIDLGLSLVRNALRDDHLEKGEVSGTIGFMSPEQACGKVEANRPASDIFSLGATLYWLLTGQAPFSGKSLAEAIKRAQRCEFDKEALNRPHIAPKLRRIVRKALEAEPDRRYASSAELADSLDRFLRRPVVIGAGAAVCLLVLLLVYSLISNTEAPRPHDPTPRIDPAPRIKWAVRDENGGLKWVAPETAIPIRTSEGLGSSWQVPAGLETSVFWLDATGEIVEWTCDTVPEEGRKLVRCPVGGEAETVMGTPGTEVIFVCGRADERPTLEEVRALVAPVGPWPRLPDNTLVYFDSGGVSQETIRSERGPGGREVVSSAGAETTAESLRQELGKRFAWFSGFAFTHVPD